MKLGVVVSAGIVLGDAKVAGGGLEADDRAGWMGTVYPSSSSSGSSTTTLLNVR